MPGSRKRSINALLGLFQTLFGVLPFRVIIFLGKRIGYFLQHVDTKRKNITESNVSFAFPNLSTSDQKTIVRKSYQNLGIVFSELLRASTITKSQLLQRITIDGLEPIQERIRNGLPTILLSAHYGNWEYLAMAAGAILRTPIGIVAHPQHNEAANERLNRIRTKFGNEIIPMGNAARTLIKKIQEGGVIAFLVDQHANPKSDPWIPFFNHATPTYEAPAALALRYNVPIYYGFATRTKSGTYYCSVKPLLLSEATSETLSPQLVTKAHVKILEETIKQNPELWSWQHRRWRDLPTVQ